ncbi:MAG: PHP domain-containing protein [Candidatus Thermoplasmatota archaeon]
MKIDIHTHTLYSGDSKTKPIELVKYSRKVGLDGIAITDHDNVKGCLECEKINSDIIVLPGVEVSCKEGHILAIGIKENIEKKLSLIETMEKIRDLGGIVIIPHPYRFLTGVLRNSTTAVKNFSEKHKKDIKCIEVINGRCTIKENRKALSFAEKFGLSKVGGSDAHEISEVGKAYTNVNANGKEDVLQAIEKGKCSPLGSGLNYGDFMKATAMRGYFWLKRKL